MSHQLSAEVNAVTDMSTILSDACTMTMVQLAKVDPGCASALAEALEDIGNRYIDMSEVINRALQRSRQEAS